MSWTRPLWAAVTGQILEVNTTDEIDYFSVGFTVGFTARLVRDDRNGG